MEHLYHYTTVNVFRRILNQGAILPDRSEPENEKERPTVTFSADPVWENTRYRVGRLPDGQLVMMGRELLKKFDGGLIRIVVPGHIAPLDWFAMKDQCGLSSATMRGIYHFAIEVGARTRNWYATFQSVPEDVWIRVDKMDDAGNWIELPDDEIPAIEGPADEHAVVDIVVPEPACATQ